MSNFSSASSPLHAPEASRFLAAMDADWERLIQTVGMCKIATTPDQEPYEALVRAISRQQVHGKAADAIMARFLHLYPTHEFPSPEQVARTSLEALRSVGFSHNKALAILGIANAALRHEIPSRSAAEQMENEQLVELLLPLRGVGRWTVEMLLIFTLERADVLPVGDFGVRNGYRLLKNLSEPPSAKVLTDIGTAWSPFRSIAAWYLWQNVT